MISKSKLVTYISKIGLLLLIGSPVVVFAAKSQQEPEVELDYKKIEHFLAIEQAEKDLWEEKTHLLEVQAIEAKEAERAKEKEERARQEQLEKEIRQRQEEERQQAEAEQAKIETVAAEEPQKEIAETVNEAPRVAPSSSNNGQLIGEFQATAYAIGGWAVPSTVTANGTDIANTIYSPEGYRIIAVDPGVIPMNSVVRVELPSGDSFLAKASDTGGAIQGYIIDILMASVGEANNFGRQHGLRIYWP